ncbi:MAG: zinc-dependent metalloprotease [Saprospiraceae bacterium]
MRVMQLLWLCIIAVQANLLAQSSTLPMRPAERVQAVATHLQQQPLEVVFDRDAARHTPVEGITDLVPLTLRTEESEALRQLAPAVLRLALPTGDGTAIELHLTRVEMPAYFLTTSADGASVYQTITPGLHYQGIVAGEPESLVAISLNGGEWSGLVSRSRASGNWVLAKQPSTDVATEGSDRYVFYSDASLFQQQHFACATPDTGEGYLREELSEMAEQARDLNDCVQIYFEVNYDIFQEKGSVQAATQYVEALFNQVSLLYNNEQIKMSISEIMVWNTPSPYTSTSSGQMLTTFQQTRTSFNGDLAQLLSYRASGGIAVVNGLCHPYTLAKMSYAGIGATFNAVPTYSWSVMVVTHELGHLLGSQHTHACVWNGNNTAIDGCPGYTEGGCANPGTPAGGGTVMSYCHLTQSGINLNAGFGTQPGNLIRNRVAAASCLSACATTGGGGSGGNPPPTTPACTQEQLFLRLQLDTYSPETTWAITNAQGAIVAQGGPYPKTRANQLVIDTLCLPQGCYSFRINDSYNDGICCTYGQGSYALIDNSQQVLAQGGAFPASETTSFCLPFVPDTGDDDCTPINFNEWTIQSFGINQDAGQYAVQDDGATLYIANNAWKSIPLSYQVTRNTVISFDFKSTREGEIHGIGFDNDNGISYSYTFKVHGIQNWGITQFDNYTGGNQWQSYTIPVGDFYIGNMNRLFFCADHDGGTRDGNAWFRNLRIYEGEDCGINLQPGTGTASLATPENVLSVYPNPATGSNIQMTVRTPLTGQAHWQIISLTGQVMQTKECYVAASQYEESIPVGQLPPGTYLLRWRDTNGETTQRFSVQ